MTVHVERQGSVAVVALSAEIDLQSSPAVRRALLDVLAQKVPVVVDMGAIHYIDSSGIACLVEGFQTARKQNTAFYLAAVSENALRVLRLARLDQVFTLAPTVDAAVDAVTVR